MIHEVKGCRKIKFRGQRKLNGKWVYGSLIQVGNDWCHIVPEGTEYDEIDTEKTRIISCTTGEWSGFLDKKKKEIYEGDILKCINDKGDEDVFVCEWGIHQRQMISGNTVDIPGFSFVKNDGSHTFPIVNNYLGKHDLKIIQVIGNIHDNPELLGAH